MAEENPLTKTNYRGFLVSIVTIQRLRLAMQLSNVPTMKRRSLTRVVELIIRSMTLEELISHITYGARVSNEEYVKKFMSELEEYARETAQPEH